ncbi:hypothetical protein [Rhodobacter viridis]|uniref:hypothetical protein n=1 Tax=Rhodobacter viridis TaxID=1054202 RepID=UPI000DA22A8F|nr:hypothetical protein [Rhodobacter viridis]
MSSDSCKMADTSRMKAGSVERQSAPSCAAEAGENAPRLQTMPTQLRIQTSQWPQATALDQTLFAEIEPRIDLSEKLS